MQLPEAIKVVLHYRQSPMTSHQIAYFLCMNNIVRTDYLQDLVHRVEEEVFYNPAFFDTTGELVSISRWSQEEQQVVRHVFDEVQNAMRLLKQASKDTSFCNDLVLALVLYKRLSDITRSQQHFTPIVPQQLKFNTILSSTAPSELLNRLSEVMDYIERTDSRFVGTFLLGREALGAVVEKQQIPMLREAMLIISELYLDEEQVSTPIFQAIFSRLIWNNIKKTSRWLETASK